MLVKRRFLLKTYPLMSYLPCSPGSFFCCDIKQDHILIPETFFVSEWPIPWAAFIVAFHHMQASSTGYSVAPKSTLTNSSGFRLALAQPPPNTLPLHVNLKFSITRVENSYNDANEVMVLDMTWQTRDAYPRAVHNVESCTAPRDQAHN